jgi:hypothetical protein
MMNGALGEQLLNGTWNQNQVIRRTIEHTVPVPSAPAPNIVPDHCRIVAMVYEVIPSLPLNNYAEIQQAEQWSLISPGYLASLRVSQHEVLGKSSVPAQFTAVLKNAGQVADTYTIGLSFNGPTGWMPSFMTKNGTFALGQTDKLTLSAGDSALINVTVDAKSIVGFGKTFLEIASPNFTLGATELRFATYGLNALLVDDDPERDHQTYLENALNHVGETYGTVSSRAILAAADLQGFNVILWMSDLAKPTLDSTEQVVLANYLDHGGKLFLNGLDIAYELADSTSPYYSARSREFFKKYVHASYVKRDYTSVVASGMSGDPITDGMAVVGLTGGTGARTIDPAAGRYANQVNAADAEAVPIFQFYQKPGDYLGIRALHRGAYGTGKVVFTTFGFETINKDADRDLLARRIIDWLKGTTRVGDTKPTEVISRFELKPNYPNPLRASAFNPGTLISYVLPNSEVDRTVSLVILNQLGQTVRVLINHPQGPGAHQVTWDGRNDQGKPLVSGVYFYKLQFGTYQETRKMVLLR